MAAAKPKDDDEYLPDYYEELDPATIKDIQPCPEKWADKYIPLPYRKLSREQWGAPPEPTDFVKLPHPITDIILTFTETPPCNTQEECKVAMRKLASDYKLMGMDDVPFNFAVGGDGTVFEGRGWNKVPDPHPEHNDEFLKSMEIAHIGFSGKFPNEAQISASWELMQEGIKEKYIALPPKHHPHFY